MSTENAADSLTARWRALFGAVIVMLILGTVYGYSIFWKPLDDYVFPRVVTKSAHARMVAAGESVSGLTVVADEAAAKALQDRQRGLLRYAFALCILTFAAVMVVAGRVQDVKGPRFTALIGGALMGAGFVLAGLMSYPIVFYLSHAVLTAALAWLALIGFNRLTRRRRQSPTARIGRVAVVSAVLLVGALVGSRCVGQLGALDRLLLLWGTVGLLAGAGIGFAYVCPIAALIKWFPKTKGLVSGIAVAGFGFGAYLFSNADLAIGAVRFIEEHGITRFFLIHGVVCLGAISVGAVLLSNPPGAPAAAARETHWRETLRRPAFYLLWPMFFSGALAGLTVIGVMKDFAGEQMVSAAGATTAEAVSALMLKGAMAVSWLAVFNAVGRICWGLVSDRIGRTSAFVAMFLSQAVMMFLLPTMQSATAIAVAACLVGFNFGGNFALFPSATADLFGAKNLGANYGLVFTSYGIAGVVGIAAGNTARALTGSYGAAFAAAGVLCLVSAALAIALHAEQRKAALATA